MVTREVWLDKLPEEKASYFNKLKMSIDLFAKHIELSAYNVEMLMHEEGYTYIERERKFVRNCDYKGRLAHIF